MVRLIRSVWYWVYIVYLSAVQILDIHLGSRVRYCTSRNCYKLYCNEVYTVANGVRPEQWRLFDLVNNDEGWVPRSDCALILSVPNLYHNFTSMYRFYMGYWYRIWVDNGIEDWCRSCDIWPKSK